MNGLEFGLEIQSGNGTFNLESFDYSYSAYAVTEDADRLTGTEERDDINARGGKDRIEGMGGADRLSGGAGKDRLFGGDGKDRLSGDGGKDVLTGGEGQDTFVFKSSNGDRVADFSLSQGDVVDISGIDANTRKSGNQTFIFIGNASFDGKAGQFRVEVEDGKTLLQGNVDGDAAEEVSIVLDGVFKISAADLVL